MTTKQQFNSSYPPLRPAPRTHPDPPPPRAPRHQALTHQHHTKIERRVNDNVTDHLPIPSHRENLWDHRWDHPSFKGAVTTLHIQHHRQYKTKNAKPPNSPPVRRRGNRAGADRADRGGRRGLEVWVLTSESSPYTGGV